MDILYLYSFTDFVIIMVGRLSIMSFSLDMYILHPSHGQQVQTTFIRFLVGDSAGGNIAHHVIVKAASFQQLKASDDSITFFISLVIYMHAF